MLCLFMKIVQSTMSKLEHLPVLCRQWTIRSQKTIGQGRAFGPRDSGKSTRKRSADLSVSRTPLRHILMKDLKMHPYKIQLVQYSKQNFHKLRRASLEAMFESFRCFNNNLFFDEARFRLNGHIN